VTVIEWMVVVLTTIGTVFLLISAIGIVRLPGVHARMHAVGKAATVGISSTLIGAGLYYGNGYVWQMVMLTILFFITAPIATSAIARAAYICGSGNVDVLEHNDMADPRYQGEDPLAAHER
jgi:multicomponent Na+:H+ antiporter subunit G